MSRATIYQNKGFSLIELVTVILLLGILSAFALGRFTDSQAIAARGFFDDTVNAVRFAQKLAISSGCEVRVISTATGFQLWQSTTCKTNNFTIAVANPGDRSANYANNNIPTGFTLSANTITFNARGNLASGAPDPIVYTLSGGSTSLNFNVYRETGLVDVP